MTDGQKSILVAGLLFQLSVLVYNYETGNTNVFFAMLTSPPRMRGCGKL
jgi:hypothetical protein